MGRPGFSVEVSAIVSRRSKRSSQQGVRSPRAASNWEVPRRWLLRCTEGAGFDPSVGKGHGSHLGSAHRHSRRRFRVVASQRVLSRPRLRRWGRIATLIDPKRLRPIDNHDPERLGMHPASGVRSPPLGECSARLGGRTRTHTHRCRPDYGARLCAARHRPSLPCLPNPRRAEPLSAAPVRARRRPWES